MTAPPGPAPTSRTFQPPTPGETIQCDGRFYRLGPLIGQGAFGAVFECTDEWANRLVAKVLLPKKTYEGVREDWLRELKTLVELRHPHITFVHDAFECRDTFYLVIERCDANLQQLLLLPPHSPDVWFQQLARQLLQAVTFIHSRSYVHKDIHPGNIFVAQVGHPGGGIGTPVIKLGDLGISRLEPEMGIHTTLAQWMRPPEAFDPAEFGAVGRPIDIYHAGLSLLAALLRQVPQFTEAEIVAGKPRATAEALNHPAAPAIARALRRHTGQRTQTGLDFWRDLKACLKIA